MITTISKEDRGRLTVGTEYWTFYMGTTSNGDALRDVVKVFKTKLLEKRPGDYLVFMIPDDLDVSARMRAKLPIYMNGYGICHCTYFMTEAEAIKAFDDRIEELSKGRKPSVRAAMRQRKYVQVERSTKRTYVGLSEFLANEPLAAKELIEIAGEDGKLMSPKRKLPVENMESLVELIRDECGYGDETIDTEYVTKTYTLESESFSFVVVGQSYRKDNSICDEEMQAEITVIENAPAAMKKSKEQIRAKLLAGRKRIDRAHDQMLKSCKEAVELIKAEPDIDKRKELIDYLFADKVEEVIEYHVRKEYLK